MESDGEKLDGLWRRTHAYRQPRSDSDLQIYGWVHVFYLVEACFYQLYKIGTAIYFLSPRWPYRVNVAISLDSAPLQFVNLVDRTRPDAGSGPETVESQIVWNSTGLENIQHTLVVSVAEGQPYAIVDGLMFAFFH